jgi:hypothetical protein
MTEQLDHSETEIPEIKRSISGLRSAVATLADIVASHETLHEETRQRFDRFVERFDHFTG